MMGPQSRDFIHQAGLMILAYLRDTETWSADCETWAASEEDVRADVARDGRHDVQVIVLDDGAHLLHDCRESLALPCAKRGEERTNP